MRVLRRDLIVFTAGFSFAFFALFSASFFFFQSTTPYNDTAFVKKDFSHQNDIFNVSAIITSRNEAARLNNRVEHDTSDYLTEVGNQPDNNSIIGAFGRVDSILRRNVRIFCLILTSSKNTNTKAVHVNTTWATHCDKYVFVTPSQNSGLPSFNTYVEEKRANLWNKIRRAFLHLYETKRLHYDWFLKADDDTYVIVENLRFMLMAYSPDEPLYFGCRFRPFMQQGYMSGGSGYVLSRQALTKLGERANYFNECHEWVGGAEDVYMGKCLQAIGVHAGDSRDAQGRHRMLPFSPFHHLNPRSYPLTKWFLNYIYYPFNQTDCCSEHMVSFHYVDHDSMHVLHHMLYRTRPFGYVTHDERNLHAVEAASSHDDTQLEHVIRAMSVSERAAPYLAPPFIGSKRAHHMLDNRRRRDKNVKKAKTEFAAKELKKVEAELEVEKELERHET